MHVRCLPFMLQAMVVVLAFVRGSIGLADEAMETWPQWRGPQRDGTAGGPQWPDTLSEDRLQELWRVALGPSYSGPIVDRNRVFTTETVDEQREVVRAFDRDSGRELWQHSWEGAMKVPFFAASNGSWIRSTPAYDGETLYVAGMRDVLAALDAKTGDPRWRVDFVKEFDTPLPAFGFVSSPLVSGDYVYVQAGGGFVKLDKNTGRVIWRTATDKGGMMGSAFSSPVLTSLQGRSVLLVQTRMALKGIDADSGEELFSREIEAFRGMNILTPTVYEEAVFTSAHSGQSQLLRLTGTADSLALEPAWSDGKTQAYMSTPVIIGDFAYLHLKNQRFTCIDLKTGDTKWRTRPYGKYWSLVAQGDRILALDERGDLLLIRARPDQFELLDSRHLSDSPTWGHLAVAGPQVFVRELRALVAYRWE